MATLPTCKYRDRVTNIRRIARRCSKNCGKINVVHVIQIIALPSLDFYVFLVYYYHDISRLSFRKRRGRKRL